MFDAETVSAFLAASDGGEDTGKLADLLNAFVTTQKPNGLPYLSLSVMQAEVIRDALAVQWTEHKMKVLTFEKLAHLPIYANVLGTEKSYEEMRYTRAQLARLELVLQQLTEFAPMLDPSKWIVFAKDPATHMVAPVYNPLMAETYKQQMVAAWSDIPIKTEEREDGEGS